MPAAATYSGKCRRRQHGGEADEAADHHDQQPHGEDRQQRDRLQAEQHADERGGAFAAAEAMPHGIDVTDDHRRCAGDGEPEPIDRGSGPNSGRSGTTAAASQPLPASMRITQSANAGPCVRSALVPPGLPLPSLRMSTPPRNDRR